MDLKRSAIKINADCFHKNNRLSVFVRQEKNKAHNMSN